MDQSLKGQLMLSGMGLKESFLAVDTTFNHNIKIQRGQSVVYPKD